MRSKSKGRVRPNFLFIGPDKTGSSWLHYVLTQHPECYVPPAKDVWFFDRYYDRGLDWYLSFFQDAPDGAKAIGELSHDYLFSDRAAERIAGHFPEIKLITCLRDPVERTYSQYLYLRRSGITRLPFEEALKEHPRLIDNSLYYKHLSNYYHYFEEENIKVLWFFQLKEDPEEFAREVFDFLDLRDVEGINYDKKVRSAGEARNFYVARILKWSGLLVRRLGLVNFLGKVKNSDLFNSLFYKTYEEGEKPNLDRGIEICLRHKFEQDIRKLEQLLNADLKDWLPAGTNYYEESE